MAERLDVVHVRPLLGGAQAELIGCADDLAAMHAAPDDERESKSPRDLMSRSSTATG